MRTNEVIESAQTLINEAEQLKARKAEAVTALRTQRDAIDAALAALGADEPAPAKRKPRKAISDEARRNISEAQKRRHRKGGEPQAEPSTQS